jgi:hypothetical protein
MINDQVDEADATGSWTRRGFLRILGGLGAGFVALQGVRPMRASAQAHRHCLTPNLQNKYIGFSCFGSGSCSSGLARYNKNQLFCSIEGWTPGGANCGAIVYTFDGCC